MIEGSLGLIVEGLVSVLLVATIFYCISVNRKLERLRSEQKGMHNFIRELSVATANADKAIRGLRATVQDTGTELSDQIDKGRNMTRLIKGEIESAQQTMNKLTVLTGRVSDPGMASANFPLPSGGGAGQSQAVTGVPAMVEDLRRSLLGFEDLEPGRRSGDEGMEDGLVAAPKGMVR